MLTTRRPLENGQNWLRLSEQKLVWGMELSRSYVTILTSPELKRNVITSKIFSFVLSVMVQWTTHNLSLIVKWLQTNIDFSTCICNLPHQKVLTRRYGFVSFYLFLPSLRYFLCQAVLALAASWTSRQQGERTLTGTVIDSGDGVTHVIPVVRVPPHSIYEDTSLQFFTFDLT